MPMMASPPTDQCERLVTGFHTAVLPLVSARFSTQLALQASDQGLFRLRMATIGSISMIKAVTPKEPQT
jgi:hypothetical protein